MEEEENNSIVYENECLVPSRDYFEHWFDIMKQLKDKHKNKLTKHLTTSLWGYLSEFDKIHLDEFTDEMSDLEEKVNTPYIILKEKYLYKNDVPKVRYICVRSDKPYKYNIARMKPFLMSYCRNYIAEFIDNYGLEDLVMRIHTDGIVLNEDVEFEAEENEYLPIPEKKTTGKMIWSNVNSYYKCCEKCHQYYNPNTKRMLGNPNSFHS